MIAPSKAATPQTIFQPARIALWAWVIMGAVFMVQGIATAGHFLFLAEGVPAWLRAMVLLSSATLAWFGQHFGREALRRLREPQPPIAVGPAGLHDRAISERPIPWSAISAVAIKSTRRGGRFVAFEIAPRALDPCGVRNGPRIEASVNRALGFPGYRIHMLGTDATPERLVDAMSPYVKTG